MTSTTVEKDNLFWCLSLIFSFSLIISLSLSLKLSCSETTCSTWGPSWVNFTNVLRGAFTCVDPKSAKKTVKLSSFFALLESVHVKAARRMLVKFTRVVSTDGRPLQTCSDDVFRHLQKGWICFCLEEKKYPFGGP